MVIFLEEALLFSNHMCSVNLSTQVCCTECIADRLTDPMQTVFCAVAENPYYNIKASIQGEGWMLYYEVFFSSRSPTLKQVCIQISMLRSHSIALT